jgi:sugar lactone lactonase YvrE
VLQISSTGLAGPPSPGKLIRVALNGKKTELAAGILEGPTGIAVSGDGDIYVVNKGSSGTDAEIVRIPAED